MFIGFMVLVVLFSTVIFHFMSPWGLTEIASDWGFIDTTIDITFLVTGVVFILVLLFLAYCVVKYKYQPDRRSEYEPENKKLEIWLTGLTTVAIAVLLAPGLVAWNEFVTVPEDAVQVEALGQQWQWSFRFPGNDGVLGTSDARNISDDNSFGLTPDDADGQDDVLIEDSELHLPLDRPIKVLLRSIDVLHDFYVPQFRAKMDMVPGAVTFFWFIPTRTGTFDILCFELCGVGHHTMRGLVVVEEEGDFEAWLQEQPTFAESLAEAATSKEIALNLVSTGSELDFRLREAARRDSDSSQ